MLDVVNTGRRLCGLPPLTTEQHAARQAERERAEVEAVQARRAALDRGEWCTGCSRPIAPGAAVALVRDPDHPDRVSTGAVVPWCLSCYEAAVAEALVRRRKLRDDSTGWWVDVYLTPLHRHASRATRPSVAPCAGCGRPVTHLPTWRHDWVACSARCRRRVYRGNRWATAACASCGRAFEPARADAAHCSGPCRQRAYRRRGRA